MQIKDKQRILNSIEKGKIKEAIDVLLVLDLPFNTKEEAQIISGRYNKLKGKEIIGILSSEQLEIAENKIIDSLIKLINAPDIETHLENKLKVQEQPQPKKRKPPGNSVSIPTNKSKNHK